MVTFIRGHRPNTGAIVALASALFLLGCVLALLEWRLPVLDPFDSGINFTRLSPLLILVVLVPATLPLLHLRHPWPLWLYAVSVELLAGLAGYFLLFHFLPRSELAPVGVWGAWSVTALSFVAIWLVSVGVASVCISSLRLLWTPRLGPVCQRCGYLLLGLRDDRCPECGSSESVAQLRPASPARS